MVDLWAQRHRPLHERVRRPAEGEGEEQGSQREAQIGRLEFRGSVAEAVVVSGFHY